MREIEENYIAMCKKLQEHRVNERFAGPAKSQPYTPDTLIGEMIDGLVDPNKTYLVMYTIEMAIELIRKGVPRSNITLYTKDECPITRKWCEGVLNIEYTTKLG